jgi:DNA polymerase
MMDRRALVMEELGLAPFWVRRELLDKETQAESQARHTENRAPAAQTTGSPRTHALNQVIRAAQKPIPTGEKRETAAPPAPQNDERALAISQMSWDELQEAVRNCTACELCQSRTQTVFGVGNPKAPLVVVGEAPGAEEDRQGEPFVGPAGKLLDNMLAAIGEKRGERVFIANVLKCRPPGNRNPQAQEVEKCAPFLHRQLELIAPRVLYTAGRFAIQTILETDAPVGTLRGRVHSYRNTPTVVSYHPAYLLRNLPDKAKAWRDLILLRAQLPQG